MHVRKLLSLACVLLIAWPAGGWDAHGHRVITLLALEMAGDDLPAWLRTESVRARIATQSNEPDRWKGWQTDSLHHVNKPDHYLDLELLDEYGLTLETMPRLRREYLRAMVISRHLHPEQVSPYDPSRDSARVHEWPGFALHAIDENYAKLQSTFNSIRILEQVDDPRRAHQLEQLRSNAIFHMGVLSHFVGDLAQPLHTTKHYDGWKDSDNPHGYRTERGIHRTMDGALRTQSLTVENLRPYLVRNWKIRHRDPWEDLQRYLLKSFSRMETVYQYERDGQINSDLGRELVIERVVDGADMLAALYSGAWRSARPSDDQVGLWLRYNDMDPAPPAATQPAGTNGAAQP